MMAPARFTKAEMIFTDLTAAIEKAARNGQRAHLTPEMARALIASPAYPMLTAAATKELVASWADVDTRETKPKAKKPASSSARSISTSGKTVTTGASAGTIPAFVHDAASARALEEAKKLIQNRPTRRGKRSPVTISMPAGQPNPRLRLMP